MVEFVQYGDTDGTLGDHAQAGNQILTVPRPPGPTIYDLLRVTGDADVLADHARGGDDTIQNNFSGVTNILTGDARIMSDHSRGGDDIIRNNTGLTNTLYGDAEQMSGHAWGGNDVLDAPVSPFIRTGAMSDLYGDAHTLSDHARGGDDVLGGALGYEGTTAWLYGDGHALLDHAKGGNDRLVSRGYGKDEMWGDAAILGEHAMTGSDTFVFAPANGQDTIHDFESGKDVIDLTAFAGDGIASFEDLLARIQVTEQGSLIDLNTASYSGNSVLVAGVQELSAGDFLFG